MSFCSAVLKPGASIFTLYLPICRSGTTYWPVSLVLIFVETLVAVLVMVTAALGTAAPDGSVTVPTMVPPVPAWPNADKAAATRIANRAIQRINGPPRHCCPREKWPHTGLIRVLEIINSPHRLK